MKRALIVMLTVLSSVVLVFGDVAAEKKDYSIRLYGLAEQFEWNEYVGGSKLVEESGPLVGFGADLKFCAVEPLWFGLKGEAFFGEVDYDGALQDLDDGTMTEYHSNTEYAGTEGEGTMGVKLSVSDSVYFMPFGGIGIKMWTRTLDTEITDKYMGNYGYEEDWFNMNGILGGTLGFIPGTNTELFVTAEVRPAIHNEMHVDLENVGGPDDLELSPGEETTLYMEAGFNQGMLTASVFYETLKFSESPLDEDFEMMYQPKSDATIIGVKAGVLF